MIGKVRFLFLMTTKKTTSSAIESNPLKNDELNIDFTTSLEHNEKQEYLKYLNMLNYSLNLNIYFQMK